MNYYYADAANQVIGPVGIEQLRALQGTGTITPDTQILLEGSEDWQPFRVVFAPIPPLRRPTAPQIASKQSASVPTTPPQQAMPQPKKRGCLEVFLIVVGVFFGLLVIIGELVKTSGLQSTTRVSSAPTSPEAAIPAAPREEPISWREVDSIYNLKSHNTDLQKDEEWKRFKGKRVTWSGTVSSVSDGWTGLTLQVKMNPETFVSDLLIKLKKAEKPKALRLHQGDRVRFTGILGEWGSLMPISLDDGEIRP